jgi:translation initiation factor 3 subunit D
LLLSFAADRYGGRPQWHPKNDGTQGLGIIGDDGIPLDEDGAFSLVDNRPKLKGRGGYGRTTFKRGMMQGGGMGARGGRGGARTANSTGFQQNRGNRVGRGGFQNSRGGRGGRGGARGGRGRGGMNNRQGQFGDRTPAEMREPSVEVDPEWPIVQDIDMSNLANFVADVDDAEDLQFAGSLETVNPKFSHITPKTAVNLARYENRQHFTATTSNDPVIDALKKAETGNVYATDVILSTLMASPRSVQSWDLLITKQGDNLYLDKRPSSKIDFVSVNENAQEPISTEKDNLNHADNLSLEATLINHNFAQQLLSVPSGQEKALPHEFEAPNPFLAHLQRGAEPASVAFRYRKWRLPGGITLVARCSLNGFVEKRGAQEGEKAFVLAKALNEFDSKLQGSVDWRQKLESQTGAVLASEMKNNQYKLSRWVSEAVLSGCDELRLGFVSRVNPKVNSKHVILMSKTYTPQTFADSVNVQVRKLWGTLAQILLAVKKLDDGSYLMMRDPQKNVLHVYKVPADAFDHELDDMDEAEQ